MTRFNATIRSVIFAASLAGATVAQAEPLTPERVFASPDLSGPRTRNLQFSPDSRIVTFLKPKPEDQSVMDLWAAPVGRGEAYRLLDGASAGPPQALSDAEQARRERLRLRTRGIVEYGWSRDGRRLLAPLDGDLWLFEAGRGEGRRLTNTPADEIDARLSPEGTFVSYVRDQGLVLQGVEDGQTVELAKGGGAVTWGLAEFVANEEMFRREGYWWSPDERRLAVARVDETDVDQVARVEVGAAGARLVQQRYPRAGGANAKVDLFITEIATRRMIKVDLGPDPDIYLARVTWSPDGAILYVQRQSRDQKRLDLLAVDPSTGSARVLSSQTSDKWVEIGDDFRPLADGRFIWSSEASGARQLYLHAASGALLRPLTSGPAPVSRLEGVDEARGRVFYSAALETPLERHLYVVELARPGPPKRLTARGGWWSVQVSNDARSFVGAYSDPSTPPRTGLYDAEGRLIRWIEENRVDGDHPLAPFMADWSLPRFGTLKAADGADLHYGLWLPKNFDPKRRYPVIVSVYGGPVSQEVRRRWGALTDQLLTGEGYVLFRLDNRGSANRDVAFKTAIHRRLGVVETKDQLQGVAYLKSLPFVDPERIGVMGWSYGGFMALTLMSDAQSPFRAGAAGAAPTDWRLYDTHYTERFMGRPSENPAGYASAAILPRLEALKGDLLLLHGMADDNVTFDNAAQVMDSLQRRGRSFELMTYPGERHLVNGQAKQLHLWRTYLDFFRRRLAPP